MENKTLVLEQIESLAKAQTPIFAEITAERVRQNNKFTGTPLGIQRHNISVWNAILSEEAGEVSQAVLDVIFTPRGTPDTDASLAIKHLRDELIQVAAVAVAIVERLDAGDPALLQPEGA